MSTNNSGFIFGIFLCLVFLITFNVSKHIRNELAQCEVKP